MTCYSRTRSAFWLCINENDDGGYNIVTSPYLRDCLAYHFSEIVEASPTGWQTTPKGHLNIWIPANRIANIDMPLIKDWAESASSECLWLSLKEEYKTYFEGTEINYCLAGNFNFDPDNDWCKTALGEAESKLKYEYATISSSKMAEYNDIVHCTLCKLVRFLPIRLNNLFDIRPIMISFIPATPERSTFSKTLACFVSKTFSLPLLEPILLVDKPEMKDTECSQKISFWKGVYNNSNNIKLDKSCIRNARIIIVDDLYQSGTTMWAYAEFLKRLGATSIYGISCVKSMRDTDNI